MIQFMFYQIGLFSFNKTESGYEDILSLYENVLKYKYYL